METAVEGGAYREIPELLEEMIEHACSGIIEDNFDGKSVNCLAAIPLSVNQFFMKNLTRNRRLQSSISMSSFAAFYFFVMEALSNAVRLVDFIIGSTSIFNSASYESCLIIGFRNGPKSIVNELFMILD